VSTFLLQELKREVAEKNAIIVVGAGVSMAATGNHSLSSWKGLLQDGIERCVSVGYPKPVKSWGSLMSKLLKNGDSIDLVSVAEQVAQRLGAPDGGEYINWLAKTVGSLPLKDRTIIDAIGKLNLPILTTNYDDLLERVTGLDAVTWQQHEDAKLILLSKKRGVLHLHGFYKDPKSVILGIHDYAKLAMDAYAMTLQKSLAIFSSIVFVGFGMGMEDPNFSVLINWVNDKLGDFTHRHYRLITEGEANAMQQKGRVFPLSYGKEHEQLFRFLDTLVSVPLGATAGISEQEDEQLNRALNQFQRMSIEHRKMFLSRARETAGIIMDE
jgi:hypothetical protein